MVVIEDKVTLYTLSQLVQGIDDSYCKYLTMPEKNIYNIIHSRNNYINGIYAIAFDFLTTIYGTFYLINVNINNVNSMTNKFTT